MPNAIKGEVPLVLGDGRTFTLVLDMEALLSIEDAVGRPLPQVMAQAGAGFVSAQAAIAQAAFARHHPEVTRAQVLELLFSPDKEAVADALAAATEKAFPEAKASAEGNAPTKARTPRGKASGRNGAKSA